MALSTQPVQAAPFDIDPPLAQAAPVYECRNFTVDFGFTTSGDVCGATSPADVVHFWLAQAPTWVHIDPNTGILTGCPPKDANIDPNNPFKFQVGATGICQCPPDTGTPCCPGGCAVLSANTVAVTLNVAPPFVCGMQINPTFYPVAWESMPFTMTLTAINGSGKYNWTATGLPAGLAVTDATNGIIGGTPNPGTCGTWNVTATVTDTDDCCCPAVNRPFVLIVDCWTNYIGYLSPGTHTTSFTVRIGPNLKQGQTNVFIDGTQKAKLGANQSQTFTTQPDDLHLVTVDQTVTGSNDTRFEVDGANQIVVGGTVTEAYFDYAQKVFIKTDSNPSGASQPPNAGFYAIGSTFSTNAASPVQPPSHEGVKYIFKEFSTPDGSMFPNRDLWFTVTKAGDVTAFYDTYYLLQVKSDNPPVNESFWALENSDATWDLALQAVPMPGILGGLGGVLKPENARGTHHVTGPDTVELLWKPVYTWPIIFILLILLVIGGLGYFLYRFKLAPARQVTTKKEAPAPKPKGKRQRYTKKTGGSKTTRRRAR